MMTLERAYDREVELLERARDEGHITEDEFYEELAELNQEYRDVAREEASRAYDDELRRW